jgi:multidrug efflux pump
MYFPPAGSSAIHRRVQLGPGAAAMKDVARQVLSEGYQLAWIGAAYQEQATGGTEQIAVVFGLIMMFLILAAQYKGWSLPLAVITAVPFALFGATLAVMLRSLQNDLYFQIGLIVLIGVAAENAILILEFPVCQDEAGPQLGRGDDRGGALRFRPIVMTSLTFVLACMPLAFSGAGVPSRSSIGTDLIDGMLSVTILAPLFVPMFYRLIEALSVRLMRRREQRAEGEPKHA